MAAFARAGLDSGLYFMDQLRREAKAVADVDLTTGGSYTIRSTVNPALQRAVETALQDGLVRYEMNYGRARFQGPETNLAKTVQRLEASASKSGATTPAWQRALTHANLMLYDVHWTPAIVTEIGGRKGGGLRVGLKDGRTVPLSVRVGRAESALKLYDIVYVKMIDGSNKTPVRAELRVPPSVLDAAPVQMHSADRVAFYQLKTILQGVVARGTAAAAADLSAYMGGKTGTSEDENDAWFAGFTNDITIVVWVDYDNASGTRRTLGGGSTGGSVALPIWESIVKAAWANGVPKAPLAPPSPEARNLIADIPIELNSGERIRGGRSAFIEHFRLDAKGALVEGGHVRAPNQYLRSPPRQYDDLFESE